MISIKPIMAITGATGYIGRDLTARAIAAGWKVRSLSRRPFKGCPGDKDLGENIEWISYDMTRPVSGNALTDAAVLIHLAADTTLQATKEKECQAAEALIDAARAYHVPFIFISSQTASPHAPSEYGRGKFMVEQLIRQYGGYIIRPGLVFGVHESGLYGKLCQLIRWLPALPDIRPAPQVWPIHLADLNEIIMKLTERLREKSEHAPPFEFNIASDKPISITEFLRQIADRRVRKTRIFIPVPRGILSLFFKIVSLLTLGRVNDSRWQSLIHLPEMETASSLQYFGIKPDALRPVSSCGHQNGRRGLIREAGLLLRYINRQRPSFSLLKRYVLAVETLRGNRCVHLPCFFYWFPVLLTLIDHGSLLQSGELAQRLGMATVLSEASPAGAARFMLQSDKREAWTALMLLIKAVFFEGVTRVFRWVLFYWLRSAVRKSFR
jgi:NADH dehydrogenase